MAALPSLQVAAEVVRQLERRGKSAPTNLEIQKLLYFCHGWSLALLAEPLVDEGFQAWRFGPVLPSVYHKFKVLASNPIPSSHPIFATIPRLPPNSREAGLISRVLEVYGDYSGFDLVNLSHQPDGPWAQIWNTAGDVKTIPDVGIQQYFNRLAQRHGQ